MKRQKWKDTSEIILAVTLAMGIANNGQQHESVSERNKDCQSADLECCRISRLGRGLGELRGKKTGDWKLRGK